MSAYFKNTGSVGFKTSLAGLMLFISSFTPTSASAVCTQSNCDRYNFEVPVGIVNTSNFPALTTMGGNVGFGTETPLQPLHVIGSARLEAESLNGTFIDFVISDATTNFTTTRFGTSQGGDFIFQSVDDSYLNPVTKMVISRSGKVGIGTETPARTLHVQTADGMRLSPSTPPTTPAAGDIIIDSGDSNTMKYYNGSTWVNAGSGGGGGGSGSVTSISTGTGLTGGPITTTGTISIAAGGVGTTEIGDNQVTDAKISAVGANKVSSGTGLYLTYKPNNTACATGQVLKWQNSRWECGTDNGTSGTVTSVDLSMPSFFSVTGNPVENSGTISVSLVNQNQNTVFAAPTSSSGTPSFRTLGINDIKSSIGGAFLSGSTCASNEALVYSSVSDTIACQVISGTSPAGSAGGDLAGNYPNPNIATGAVTTTKIGDSQVTDAKIVSISVTKVTNGTGAYFTYAPNNSACSTGEVLKWQNSRWECAADSNTTLADGSTSGEFLSWNGSSWAASTTGSALTGLNASQLTTGTLPTSRLPAFSGGDITSTTGSAALTLSNTGVPSGTYQSVTVDSKGRVTAGSNPTTLSGFGITDAVANAGGIPSVQSGPDALKPAAGTAGRIYVSTDAQEIYQDTGSSWILIGKGNNFGSGTVTGISTGAGLTGGPITESGTIAIAPGGVSSTELANDAISTAKIADAQVTNAKIVGMSADKLTSGSSLYLTYAPNGAACSAGEVLKWNNSRWECGQDQAGAASPLTSKGDIFVHNGTTNARLASGTDGKVLKADSSQSNGLTWGDAIASDLTSITGTGIVQRNGASSYSTVGVNAPLTYAAGNLGVSTASGGVLLDGGNTLSGTMSIGTNSNHALQIRTNGGTRMTIDPNGRIGIGTTTPTRYLDVNGPIRLIASALPGTPSVGDIGIDIHDANKLKYYNGTTWVIAGDVASSNPWMRDGGGTGPNLYYTSGKVGIGTSSPTHGLTVTTAAMINDIYLGRGSGGNQANIAIGNTNTISSTGNAFTATDNIGIGNGALQGLSIGSENIAIGSFALKANSSSSNSNTIIGHRAALYGIGSQNTVIGANALPSFGSGDYNTVIGYNSGTNLTTGSRNTILGPNVYLPDGTIRNIAIADGYGQQRIRIDDQGRVGLSTITAPTHVLHIPGQGRSTHSSWATTSDERLKNEIAPYQYGLKEISRMRTIWYQFKKDNELNLPSKEKMVGVVAQELRKIMPETVRETEDGYLTIDSDPIHWAAVNAIKELSTQVNDLKSRNQLLTQYICSKDPEASVCRQ